MAWNTPTLAEVIERQCQAFRNELPGTDARIWPNNITVSAKVMGAGLHSNFLWLAYIAKQRFTHLADGEFLDLHGRDYGLPRLAASFARGKVTLSGTSGTAVPAGLKLQRGDGAIYTITAGGIVSGGGTLAVDVASDLPGSAYNTLAGAGMSLIGSFANLSVSAVVHADGIGLGADEEGDESYRARILHRKQMPPHGGAAHDYVAWAREIPGVSRVFVDPLASGPGTVTVYFLMDDLYPNGIPQGADVAAVEAYISAVRPVTAQVTVLAPTTVPVNVTITGLTPDTTEVRDAVTLELADLFRRYVPVSTVAAPFTLYRSKLWEAISLASGEDHHTLTDPAIDEAYTAGQLPVLGTVTFA